jgi:adenine-specific DNA-methyltransferase
MEIKPCPFSHISTDNEAPVAENEEYLKNQLITYIGNKRSLLYLINKAIISIKKRIGKDALRTFDVFSGSGIVSRLFKSHSSYIIANDIEDYAHTISKCYLTNRSEVNYHVINNIFNDINNKVINNNYSEGFIEELYSPNDDQNITIDDRVFYTKNNARRIDNYRRLIDTYPKKYKKLLLGPLLSEASIHANTAGVFKGFYKNVKTKIGQYGGSNSDALTRILGDIILTEPILSNYECDYAVYQEDANALVRNIDEVDIAYIDPPYNQHPYGSNYFMLNLINNYKRPGEISKVSGIPKNWKRSGYNVRKKSKLLVSDLVNNIKAKYLLISYNDEGFISPDDMMIILNDIGKVEVVEKKYNAFRGSRSFKNRSIHVTEQLFIVERR